MRAAFEKPYNGIFLLGGLTLNNLPEIRAKLARFWKNLEMVDGEATRFPEQTIPFMIHGDEGCGQAKRPVLIVSFQPVLGWKKDAHLTMDDILNSKKSFGALK